MNKKPMLCLKQTLKSFTRGKLAKGWYCELYDITDEWIYMSTRGEIFKVKYYELDKESQQKLDEYEQKNNEIFERKW